MTTTTTADLAPAPAAFPLSWSAGGAVPGPKHPLADVEDAFLAALSAWREAGGQGDEGMRAVLHVEANRARDWKVSLVDVIVGKNQFSSMTVAGDPSTVRWPRPSDAAFLYAWDLAHRLAQDEDPTHGAHYYANLQTMTSPWFKEKIAGDPTNHPVTAVIGAHTFYR